MLPNIDTTLLELLDKVAASRSVSSQALARSYLVQGLQHDLGQLLYRQKLETINYIVQQHIRSKGEHDAGGGEQGSEEPESA